MRSSLQKSILVIALCLSFIMPVKAEVNGVDGAKMFVKGTALKVVNVIQSNGSTDSKKVQLTNIFERTMDIGWISRFVIGKYWRQMSDAEKSEYTKAYKKYIIAAYVPKFREYNGQTYKIKYIKPLKGDQYLVGMDIESKSSATPYRVEYRLKFLNGSFKVRDIIAEGISLLSTHRSEFAAIVSKKGIPYLNYKLGLKAGAL